MPKLSENQVFTLLCDEIEEAFDTFTQNGSGHTMYCHKFILSDDQGEQYPTQWCTEYPTQDFCKAGDVVKVQIKKLTRGIYTMVPQGVVKPENATPPKMEESYSVPYQGPIGDPIKTYNNPNIAGTIYDRSMTLAIAYYKDNEVPFENVEMYADKLVDWFKRKLQE
jgi:hypothetical protein